MRFNESILKFVARVEPGEKEGRMNYRTNKEQYKQRWFKLKGNLLFYFRTNEFGQLSDPEAIGVLVLESCNIKIEPFGDQPFVFSLVFEWDPEKVHLFSCQTMDQCEQWITALKAASYKNLQNQVEQLKAQILQKTGKDPVEEMKCRNLLLVRASSVGVRRSPAMPRKVVPTRPAPPPPGKRALVATAATMVPVAQTKAMAGKIFNKVKSVSTNKELLLKPSALLNWETFD